MYRQRAFTLIELLVVIAIIAILVGLLFPAIGAVRRYANQQENNAQVRNILQGMIQFSGSHRGFFPGFDGAEFTPDTLETTGLSGPGQTPEARYWLLLDGNYTEGKTLVSAAETKAPWPNLDLPPGPDQMKVTTNNYSFALANIGSNPSTDPFAGNSSNDRFRRKEWRNEQNPLAPLVSDRIAVAGSVLPTAGAPQTYLSIHDGSKEGKWLGSIGYGDLSVEFSDTSIVTTRFAGLRVEADDIFTPNDGLGSDPLKNAEMTYRRLNQPMGALE